jgi:hypothetical protein
MRDGHPLVACSSSGTDKQQQKISTKQKIHETTRLALKRPLRELNPARKLTPLQIPQQDPWRVLEW